MTSVDAICARAGVRIVKPKQRRGAGETYARDVLETMLREHGEQHVGRVLHTVLVSQGSRADLWSETIGCVSDAMVRHPQLVTAEALSGIDLEALRTEAKRSRMGTTRVVMTVLLLSELMGVRVREDTALLN